MDVGACEECGEFETLYACGECEQSLCEHCYGDTRLLSCYDCLSAMEGPALVERIQPGQRGGEQADRDGRKGGRFGSKAPQRGRVKF